LKKIFKGFKNCVKLKNFFSAYNVVNTVGNKTIIEKKLEEFPTLYQQSLQLTSPWRTLI